MKILIHAILTLLVAAPAAAQPDYTRLQYSSGRCSLKFYKYEGRKIVGSGTEKCNRTKVHPRTHGGATIIFLLGETQVVSFMTTKGDHEGEHPVEFVGFEVDGKTIGYTPMHGKCEQKQEKEVSVLSCWGAASLDGGRTFTQAIGAASFPGEMPKVIKELLP